MGSDPPATSALSGTGICMLVMNDVRRDSRVIREADALSAAGARVLVVGVGDGPAPTFDSFDVRLVRPPSASTIGLRPLRVALNLRANAAFARRFARAAAGTRADVYHCHDLNTYEAGERAAGGHACIVYDSHELFLDAGDYSDRVLRRLRAVEQRAVADAALVLAANQERADVMRDEYGMKEAPTPLLNVADDRPLDPQAVAKARAARSRIKGAERIILYQGAFSRTRGLEALIEGLAALGSGAHLVLMGGNSLPAWLASIAQASPAKDRVHHWPAVPSEDVVAWASVADVGVVTYLPVNRNNLLCAPNKLYEYAQAGIPILAADLPPLRRIWEETPFGELFEPGESSSFSQALSRLFGDTDHLGERTAGAVRMAASTTWEQQASLLVKEYASMLGRCRG